MAEYLDQQPSLEEVLSGPARAQITEISHRRDTDPAVAVGIIIVGNALIRAAYLSSEVAKRIYSNVAALGKSALDNIKRK
jgi:hypothetical protein